jgi:hypothetical protein
MSIPTKDLLADPAQPNLIFLTNGVARLSPLGMEEKMGLRTLTSNMVFSS